MRAVGIAFVSLLFSATPVFAGDVVINEFLVDPSNGQWVELYNRGENLVEIGGWVIDDSGGTEKFTIPGGTIISPGEFAVFESSLFNFNPKTGDTAQLLNGTSVEDSHPYGTGPGANHSFGRNQDGVGSWVSFGAPTKGSSNNSSTPAPTATSTPMPTPEPTATPHPTATPRPTATPKPTPTTRPSSSSNNNPTSAPAIGGPVPTIGKSSIVTSIGGDILSANDQPEINLATNEATPSVTPAEVLAADVMGSTSNVPRLVLMGLGLLCIIGGAIILVWKKLPLRKMPSKPENLGSELHES